jgi:iron complex transport system ATP-binding protein
MTASTALLSTALTPDRSVSRRPDPDKPEILDPARPLSFNHMDPQLKKPDQPLSMSHTTPKSSTPDQPLSKKHTSPKSIKPDQLQAADPLGPKLTTPARAVLEVQNLSAGYPSPGGQRTVAPRIVVYDTNFQAIPGQVLAILGANGSGKTTLLKSCIGLLKPLQGTVMLGGKPLTTLSARDKARLVAWVPQTSANAWSYTAREVVAQGRFASLGPFKPYTEQDRTIVDQALSAMDAGELADRNFATLSGGEARRILIARALAQDTPLLALDEPAAHLDPGRQMELMETLTRLAASGKAVLVSIHDVNAARRFADSIILIDRQGQSHYGTAADVLSPDRLEEAYDTEFLHGDHESYGRFVLPLARRRKAKQQ